MSNDTKAQLLRCLDQALSLFEEGHNAQGVSIFSRISQLKYDSDDFWKEITSLEIWGGSGSLFDQAFVIGEDAELLRKRLDQLLLELSEVIIQTKHANHFVASANIVLHTSAKKARASR